MRFFYTCLFCVLLPLAFLRLWQKGKALPAYRQRWCERRGLIPKNIRQKIKNKAGTDTKCFWFHTVSVGEFIAARPLIEHYRKQANTHIVLTCTTPTGSERIHASFGDYFDTNVSHVYLPYDIPLFFNRFLAALKPDIFICLETELWPNLLIACKKRDIPVVLANARLSEKSARGYQKVASLTRTALKCITKAAIQNETDRQRFTELGLDPSRSQSIGNIKFDLDIDEQLTQRALQLKTMLSLSGNNTHDASLLFIAASTHKGEDEIILNAFSALKAKHPSFKLLLVPRHPERFDSVFELCKHTGFNTLRRSKTRSTNDEHTQQLPHFDIMLGDTMGEMMLLFGASDIAFIGGSFVENGGHNYIEPAAWSLPLISGTSTYNFRETAEELVNASALTLVENEQALIKKLDELIQNKTMRENEGQKAKQVADKNRGALSRLIKIIDNCL